MLLQSSDKRIKNESIYNKFLLLTLGFVVIDCVTVDGFRKVNDLELFMTQNVYLQRCFDFDRSLLGFYVLLPLRLLVSTSHRDADRLSFVYRCIANDFRKDNSFVCVSREW